MKAGRRGACEQNLTRAHAVGHYMSEKHGWNPSAGLITAAGRQLFSTQTHWYMNTTTCWNQTVGGGCNNVPLAARYAAEVADWGQITGGQPQLSCLICHMVSHNLARM